MRIEERVLALEKEIAELKKQVTFPKQEVIENLAKKLKQISVSAECVSRDVSSKSMVHRS